MSQTIPTTEPVFAVAGDTWRWARDLPDYPASDWTLTYTVFSASAVFSIVAAASGERHLVEVPPDDTAAHAAGRYDWIARVTDGSDIYTVGSGVLTIQPVPSAAYDGRSHARKMLAAINALLEQRATDGDLDVIKTALGDRATEWDLERLMKLRQQYAAAVKAEDDAEKLARGESIGRFIQTRFVG